MHHAEAKISQPVRLGGDFLNTTIIGMPNTNGDIKDTFSKYLLDTAHDSKATINPRLLCVAKA